MRLKGPSYPWHALKAGRHRRITKAFFRCNCEKRDSHSLPIWNKEEHIYPILMDLINHVQEKTGKRVIITSGHRCPEYNTLLDPSAYNATSKHLIGAEVDFYVEGLEWKSQEVLEALFSYYSGEAFFRYHKPDTNVSTPPWYNREVFVKLFLPNEGRNLDNAHNYPYISVQVRWDRKTGERVHYSWARAHQGYVRY